MPVRRTTTVETKCGEVFVEAVPWVNNMFRLTRVCWWGYHGFMPEQIHLNHHRIGDAERQVYLEAIVKEWNLYARDDDPLEGKRKLEDCVLVLDCDKAAG